MSKGTESERERDDKERGKGMERREVERGERGRERGMSRRQRAREGKEGDAEK